MFGKFGRYLHGRVTIQAQGKNLAGFINEALKDRIEFYNGKKLTDSFLAEINAADFRRLRKAAKKAGIKINIRNRYGFPFVALRWQKRKGLIFGVFIIIAALTVLSQYVLSISVEGNSRVSADQIIAEAGKAGLNKWVLKSSLDLDQMSKQVQESMPDLVWMTMEERGTNIKIRVVEKTLPQTVLFQGDLLAAKTGYVEDVIVIQGQALIAEGQLVTAGQVLIKAAGGMMEYSFDVSGQNRAKQNATDAPAAKGFVRARVWYSADKIIPMEEDRTEKTANRTNGWGIKINNRVIMIMNQDSPYSDSIQETCTYALPGWRNWRFPVELLKVHYEETQKTHVSRTAAEAKKLAETLAREELKQKLPSGVKVLHDKVRILSSQKGTEHVRVEVETFEDIAVYKK